MKRRRTQAPGSDTFRRADKLDRQLFLGFVRTHILFHASESPICGVEITDELGRHGYHLSPGMLYPTLHGLTAARYLRCYSKVKNGRVRKYYSITSHGRWALGEAKKRLKELVKEVLESETT
ncbi:PadR family transcriptional regulator [Nitrospira sp.]|nr:PadR family transcriptional regulator [Nitrospira sp.]